MDLLPQNMFLSARVALLGTNFISVGAHGVLCQVAGDNLRALLKINRQFFADRPTH